MHAAALVAWFYPDPAGSKPVGEEILRFIAGETAFGHLWHHRAAASDAAGREPLVKGWTMGLIPPTDSMYLIAESRDTPMHVGGLQIFDLPEDEGPDWVGEQFEEMLTHDHDVAPLFHKRPYRSLGTGGQWAWREDDELDPEYHVRRSALPAPGRPRELLALGSRLHGSLLDRQRPLWELHLIEGYGDRGFALYTKIHHGMLDGVSALRLLERSLSPDPHAVVSPPWTHRRQRSDAHGSAGFNPLAVAVDAVRGGADLALFPPAVLRAARRAIEEPLAAFPFKAPPSIFNVHITGARRLAADSWSLPRVKALARSAGATVNDIALAMCSGALRAYLTEQSALPDEALTSMVPVSLRHDDSAGGNAVGAVLTSLATDVADPVLRLERIRESMGIAKSSIQSLSPLQILAMSALNMVPAPLMSMIGGGENLRPPFNLIISNIPGPRHALYLNGARLRSVYPASIPYHGQALNITITSYGDDLQFGLTGCRRRVPSLQRILVHLEDSLLELEAAMGLVKPPRTRRPPVAENSARETT